MWRTNKIKLFSQTLLLVLIAGDANIGHANSHLSPVVLRPHAPELDMLITGANKSSRRTQKIPPDARSNSKCPLCYHRELMKSQKGGKLLKPSQPFPGD